MLFIVCQLHINKPVKKQINLRVVPKLISLVMQYRYHVPLDLINEDRHHFCDISAKTIQPQSNYKKTFENPELKEYSTK